MHDNTNEMHNKKNMKFTDKEKEKHCRREGFSEPLEPVEDETAYVPEGTLLEEALIHPCYDTSEDTNNRIATNLTGRGMIRAILILAVPAVTTLMMESVHHLVDAFWVGRIGTEALAAVSGAMFLLWMVYSVVKMAAVGINTVVARRTGAELYDEIPGVVANGIILALGLSLIVMIPLLFKLDYLISALGIEGEVFAYAENYLWVFVLSLPLIYLVNAVDAAFKGGGDTKTPMILFVISVIINATLNPFLIFGWSFFPEMSLKGAALATVFSKLFFLIGGGFILIRRGTIKFTFKHWSPHTDLMIRMLKIGAPVAASSVMFSLVYVALTRIISDFGAIPLASLGLGHRIESIAYFICFGFHVASATIVGQYMGAGKPEEAEKAAWTTLGIALVPAVPIIMVFIFASEWAPSFFTQDPLVIAECGTYLRIIGYFEIFQFIEFILQGAFSGAGDSVPPMLISIPLSIARVPAAWFFSIHMKMGPEGIWWAISLSSLIKGILMAYWFRRGKWKEAVV